MATVGPAEETTTEGSIVDEAIDKSVKVLKAPAHAVEKLSRDMAKDLGSSYLSIYLFSHPINKSEHFSARMVRRNHRFANHRRIGRHCLFSNSKVLCQKTLHRFKERRWLQRRWFWS